MPTEEEPPWRPLFVRDTPSASDHAVLAEGIPEWLERSLWRWAMDRAVRVQGLDLKAERTLRVTMPRASGRSPFALYWDTAGEEERLALLDFFLHDLETVVDEGASPLEQENYLKAVWELDNILVEGGSMWEVALQPYWGLRRRVNETTQTLVDLASSPETDAGRKIASAWNACYRHDPDYDRAYRDAVLAVEAVALPIVLPNSTRGTLGTAVAHIADTVTRWTVAGLDADQQASGATLLCMLRTLWHNQQRHAQPDGTIRDVSYPEAQTAVTLAVTLVHWFASGLVRRVQS